MLWWGLVSRSPTRTPSAAVGSLGWAVLAAPEHAEARLYLALSYLALDDQIAAAPRRGSPRTSTWGQLGSCPIPPAGVPSDGIPTAFHHPDVAPGQDAA